MSRHYIAINQYRSSTDDGFGNTWMLYLCTREEQRKLLTDGLPVSDVWYEDGTKCWSTRGIRTLTKSERRQALRAIREGEMREGLISEMPGLVALG